MQSIRSVLVLTRGHPFARDAFSQMLEAIAAAQGLDFTLVEHPAASAFYNPALAAPFDALLFYDMPGYAFHPPTGVDLLPAPASAQEDFKALTQQGKPLVFLHHALAGWPVWDDYGEAIGGRFLYQPGHLRGRHCPDSGYRHDVSYTAEVLADHPVTAGLPTTFEITDELYLAEVFHKDILPLVRARHAFTADNFYSADHAVHGRMFSNDGWQHEGGSDLIVWAKAHRSSPVAYVQSGDGPAAYDNRHVRRLIGNALVWAMSDQAGAWAREVSAAGA